MPDLLAIAQGLNAVKATTDIIKTIAGLRDSAQILEKTVELNQKILSVQTALADAQTEQATLVQTIRNLEEEIARFEAWEAEKQKYELKQVSPVGGAVAYMLKPDARSSEPPHWLCAQCYQNRKISLVQIFAETSARSVYKCHGCSATFQTNRNERPAWI